MPCECRMRMFQAIASFSAARSTPFEAGEAIVCAHVRASEPLHRPPLHSPKLIQTVSSKLTHFTCNCDDFSGCEDSHPGKAKARLAIWYPAYAEAHHRSSNPQDCIQCFPACRSLQHLIRSSKDVQDSSRCRHP